jgi:hypothetical protein
MPVHGTLKMNELRLAQVSVDLTKGSLSIVATTALVDPTTGATCWYKCTGNAWGTETIAALTQLIRTMEQDIAQTIMSNVKLSEEPDAERLGRTERTAGIGEYVGVDGVPEM